MLIGVDCGLLTDSGRTGTHNYLYNLLKNLAVLDLENEYILYFRDSPSQSFWFDISSGNTRWRYKILRSRISWVQVGLALATFRDRPDRLLCTWHTMPLFHNPFTRIISVIHDFSGKKRWPIYACLYMSYRLVGVSGATYSGIVKRVPWRKPSIYRIYEGVDLTKFNRVDTRSVIAVKNKFGLNKNYFLSVSTLNRRKNLENMISAFSKLIQDAPELDMDYVIVGKCEKGYESIYEYARSVDCSGRIKFLGYVDDLTPLYSGAAALLYVSLEEGFGLPILEAFACECPVITANISSTAEVGNHAVYLADPYNVKDIEDKMYKVLTLKDETRTRVLRGLERILIFSWDVCARKMIEIY